MNYYFYNKKSNAYYSVNLKEKEIKKYIPIVGYEMIDFETFNKAYNNLISKPSPDIKEIKSKK